MFVQLNSLAEIKAYFKRELSKVFSNSEIKHILKQLTVNRFNISDIEYMLFDSRLSESDLLYYHFALKRLKANEPFQYILGSVEFAGIELKIDRRALIPRPETEELVEWILAESKGIKKRRLLDLCTGSGCIALALKHHRHDFLIDAVEKSEEAIELFVENRKRLNLDVKIYSFDVLNSDQYTVLDGKYDVWVANPPYIPISDRSRMHKNVLDFEPEMALFVGNDDPLLFYRSIALNARKFLSDHGMLYFEIHEDLGSEMLELLTELGFFNIELRKDLQGKDRMVRAQVLYSHHE